MTSTSKLRLGPLPKTDTVKMTFVCPVGLKSDLDRYAALHAQTYGEAVDAVALIPHMLEAFIGRDRTFKRTRANPNLGKSSRTAQAPLLNTRAAVHAVTSASR